MARNYADGCHPVPLFTYTPHGQHQGATSVATSVAAVPARQETHTISGTCNHRSSQTGFRESSSDPSKPTLAVTHVTCEETWASCHFYLVPSKLVHSPKRFESEPNPTAPAKETRVEADGCEGNPGRHGTDGAIRRPVRCLWEVKKLLFLFFLNYGLSAPVYQSKARTEEKEQREPTKGENPTSLGSTDPKENFQSPEVENNPIAAVEETLSAWQPCWAVGRHRPITAAQYASLRIVGHRGAECTSCSCRKPS